MPKRNHPAQARWDAAEARLDTQVKELGGKGFRYDAQRIKDLESMWAAAYVADQYSAYGVRMDTGYYFARETEAVQAEILMVENAESKGANGTLFPIDNFGGEMARSVVQRQHEGVGRARVGGHAATDAPIVTVIGEESERQVRPIDAAYIWTVKDVALGDATGQPLDRSMALAAREACDQELDEIVANGHLVLGLGVNNTTAVSSSTLVYGDWIALSRTADQIIADILQMKREANEDTDGRAVIDHVALPPAYLMHVDGLRLGDTAVSVREYIEKVTRVTLVDWHALKDGGASGQDVMFGYKRDSKVIKVSVPVPFKQLPPQAKSRAWVINTYCETAGLIIDKPNYCRRAFLTSS